MLISPGAFAAEDEFVDIDQEEIISIYVIGPCPIRGTHEAVPRAETTVHVHPDDRWELHMENLCMSCSVYRCVHCGAMLYIGSFDNNRYYVEDFWHTDSSAATVWDVGTLAIKYKQSSTTWNSMGWTFLQE